LLCCELRLERFERRDLESVGLAYSEVFALPPLTLSLSP
jgi:hypothetical protein